MTIPVAILGATGVVGQKVIALLSQNQHFKITELVASNQRVGSTFGEVCEWREQLMPLSTDVASIKLIDINNVSTDLVISCLPPDIADKIEPCLAKQGRFVFSNASAFRMHSNVPLLIPEINLSHLSLMNAQHTTGKIITNPNCAATGIALGVAPLMKLGTIQHISAVTMQSISGAGYPGVPSLDILCNTIPHIPHEAKKINEEIKKILGSPDEPASFAVTTHVHRVPVTYGHTVTLHITFTHDIRPEWAQYVYSEWNSRYPDLFILYNKEGRPQCIKDLRHNDMRVHIGHICRGDMPNILGLVLLTHNLVRGAAGAVIANMEAFLNFQRGKTWMS